MDSFVNVCLSNAVVAGVLGIVAGVAPWLLRKPRPALIHSLWLIVFLKLVTPPIAEFPIYTAEAGPIPVETAVVELAPVDVIEIVEDEVPTEFFEVETPEPEAIAAPFPWREVLTSAWFAGAVLFWGLALSRAWRFGRALRDADEASEELREQVSDLAALLEISRIPRVLIAPGPLPPMLWGFGCRPILVLPGALWKQLNEQQRLTLLTHELAHLKRGDHLFRLLELVASGMYWWHPIVWWGRIAAREAEEQCCDAWVVWAMPKQARGYAEALVRALDFISDAGARAPVLASGIGHASCLKRRIRLIMNARTDRGLTRAGRLFAAGLAATLLAASPTLAQRPETAEAERAAGVAREQAERAAAAARDQAERARAVLEETRAKVEQDARKQAELVREAVRKAHEAMEKAAKEGKVGSEEAARVVEKIREAMGREIERSGRAAREEVERARDSLRRAEERGVRDRAAARDRVAARQENRGEADRAGQLRREIGALRERLARLERELGEIEPQERASANLPSPRNAPIARRRVAAEIVPPAVPLPPEPPSAGRSPIAAPPRVPAPARVLAPVPAPAPLPVPSETRRPVEVRRREAPRAESDDRIRELEQKLEQVLKQIESMRQEKARNEDSKR